MRTSEREVGTPLGPARVHVARGSEVKGTEARGTLLLGHGASGGIGAADLQAAAKRAVAAGWVVGLVEQPWRVVGRRVATPPPQLDIGWTGVVQGLETGRGRLPRPFVFGGRSAGARVACRLAGPLGAAGVVALAFPLHPPGKPERSRFAELAAAVAAKVPVAVIQGERDPFGTPDEVRSALAGLSAADRKRVHLSAVPGDHGLKGGVGPAADAVEAFLRAL